MSHILEDKALHADDSLMVFATVPRGRDLDDDAKLRLSHMASSGGSLVDGYRLSFLIATGLAVLAAIIVALQLSSKSHRIEPAHQQAAPGAPPAPAQLGKS